MHIYIIQYNFYVFYQKVNKNILPKYKHPKWYVPYLDFNKFPSKHIYTLFVVVLKRINKKNLLLLLSICFYCHKLLICINEFFLVTKNNTKCWKIFSLYKWNLLILEIWGIESFSEKIDDRSEKVPMKIRSPFWSGARDM